MTTTNYLTSLSNAIASASNNPTLLASLSNELASLTVSSAQLASQSATNTLPSVSAQIPNSGIVAPLSSLLGSLPLSASVASTQRTVASASNPISGVVGSALPSIGLVSSQGIITSVSNAVASALTSLRTTASVQAPISVPSALSVPILASTRTLAPSLSIPTTVPSSSPSIDYRNAAIIGNVTVEQELDGSVLLRFTPSAGNALAAISLLLQAASSLSFRARVQFSIRVVLPVITPNVALPVGRLRKRQNGAGCNFLVLSGDETVFDTSVASLSSSFQLTNTSDFTSAAGQPLTFAEQCADGAEYLPVEVTDITVTLLPPTAAVSTIPTSVSGSGLGGSLSAPTIAPDSTCPVRSRVIVTITPTITSCPGTIASTCTFNGASSANGGASSPSSTSNVGSPTTTLTTVVSLCFNCALTPTVVTSTYTETIRSTTDSTGQVRTITHGGPPVTTTTTTQVLGGSVAPAPASTGPSPSYFSGNRTVTVFVTTSILITTTGSNGRTSVIASPSSYPTTVLQPTSYPVFNPSDSGSQPVPPASETLGGYLTTVTNLRTVVATETALSTMTNNGKPSTITSVYLSTGTRTTSTTLSIFDSTTLVLTRTSLTSTYIATASITNTLSNGQVTTFPTIISSTTTLATVLTLSQLTATSVFTETRSVVTIGPGGVPSTAISLSSVTVSSTQTLTLQASTQTSTQLSTSSYITTGPNGLPTTSTTLLHAYITRVTTNSLATFIQTTQVVVPTTRTTLGPDGASIIATNVVSDQITTLFSTLDDKGSTTTVSGRSEPAQSGSYILTTEQITSVSYGVTSTVYTNTDPAGNLITSTSYGVQSYPSTIWRTTRVLAPPYHNGGGPPATVTISVTGQTTVTEGQTFTITQASGTLTLVQFQNGTVTIPGPTVTAQGPTVTAPGQTITAPGQTITAPGQTVQGATVTVTTTNKFGSTALPDCPNEVPGRVFDGPYGGEYAIFCGYAYLDPDCTIVTSSSLGSCAQACDAYNIQHFYDTTTCVGVTFFSATGQCHLKANTTIPYATNGADSCTLENPYQGGVTQLFPTTTLGGMGSSGTTVTVTSVIAGYTPEVLVNCPQDNGTVLTLGSDEDAFLIECNVNRPGDDLPSMPYFVPSFRSCIDACTSDPNCYDCTYFPSSSAMNPCYLKSNVSTAVSDTTCWSAKLIQGPVCPRDDGKLYVTNGENFVIECFTDHQGCNFVNMPIQTHTFGECLDLCAANSECVDASWTPGTPQGSCTLKSCIGTSLANQTSVWGARILNGTGSGGTTVTAIQTVPTTILTTAVRSIFVSITTTVTLVSTSNGVAITQTSTQTLLSTQTNAVTETITSNQLITTTFFSGASNAYPNATATVTTTLVSNHYITVTVAPSSRSSTFTCLTQMTNYLPASASGGMKVKRNEYLFDDAEIRRRAEIGARIAKPEFGGLGWVV